MDAQAKALRAFGDRLKELREELRLGRGAPPPVAAESHESSDGHHGPAR